jgi:hypothetical protein
LYIFCVIIYVIIWCFHLLLSFPPFFLFPENVTHSILPPVIEEDFYKTAIRWLLFGLLKSGKYDKNHRKLKTVLDFAHLCTLGNVEWFMEDQAFSSPYDLAPLPPLPPSSVSKLDRRHTRRKLADWWGRTGWGRSQIGEKTWSSINHSILSAAPHPPHTNDTLVSSFFVNRIYDTRHFLPLVIFLWI